MRQAKTEKRDLSVVWLDLANAYGSIPHKLIEEALQHYHVPEHVQTMIIQYFSGMNIRFTTGNTITAWQDLEKGIVTGCTVFPILFIMRMNIIMKAGERETRGPRMKSGSYQPALRGFMDDLTITTTSIVQARWVLNALDDAVTWARMKFKPKKSRFAVIKKGCLIRNVTMRIQGEEIPQLVDNHVKALGKWYDDSLGDHRNVDNIKTLASTWPTR